MNIYAFSDEASSRVDDQIRAMLRNGLNGTEARDVDGQNIADIDTAKAKEVLAKLKDNGLRVWSIGSPIGKIDIETGDWAAHQLRFRRALENAVTMECGNLRMFSFYIPKGKDPADFRGEIIDRLSFMAETAKEYGVALCHENEKGIYGDIAVRCDDVLKAVPALKCIFDPANFIQCGQDIPEAWKLLGDRVYYMHIKDALPDGTVVPAGKGVGHLKELLAAFIRNGGENVTVEPHLRVFDGFAALENGQKTVVPEGAYATSDDAFDAACGALKAIL